MRLAHALTLALTVLCLAPLANAQEEMPTAPPPPQDAALDTRVGDWVGTGTLMGMPVTETVHMDWVMGHHFFRANATTQMTMPDGQAMTMESEMTSQPDGAGNYVGMYMNDFGVAGDFTGRTENGALIIEWTDTTDGSNNRMVETNNPDGGWTAVMSIQGPDGSWTDMGNVVYTRATP